eukprot:TRINITY_DN79966_c0_g1_i1.p1 TRINITY_DN79966_c0_g1~~TRINITY_DN79966_c0_g1_i1.p1  ORF type:complete len:447 (-),score=60.82 TRINITY_DN79966_c0_g1_i1:418-1758(-)
MTRELSSSLVSQPSWKSCFSRIKADLAAAMPELGWSVCEPLFMPILVDLKVPDMFLASCWLISPSISFFLQPCIGSLSDRLGRKPFIIAFGATASLGLLLTALAASVLPRAFAAPAAVAAFGLADVSHDVLVTPTRAQMNDIVGPDEAETRSAVAGGSGKLFALLCSMLLPSSTAFFLVGLVVAFATIVQLAPSPVAAEAATCSGDTTQSRNERSSLAEEGTQFRYPEGFWPMWILQFGGWLSTCTWSFYFTSVWAEIQGAEGGADFHESVQSATRLLLFGAFVFLGSAPILPRLSGPSGLIKNELNCLMLSLLVMMVTLLSLSQKTMMLISAVMSRQMQLTIATILVVVFYPVAYQVLANIPFAWLERQPEFDSFYRGRLSGTFNSSIAVAQALTALVSGPVVAAFGGQLSAAYLAVAGVDAALLVFVLLIRLRRYLRSRRSSEQ